MSFQRRICMCVEELFQYIQAASEDPPANRSSIVLRLIGLVRFVTRALTRTLGHADTWTLGHLDTWTPGHLDTRTLGHTGDLHKRKTQKINK